MPHLICVLLLINSVLVSAASNPTILSLPGTPSIPFDGPDIPRIPVPDTPFTPEPDRPQTPTVPDPFQTGTDQENCPSCISAKTAGIWYNPEHDGEGFFIHIDDQLMITVAWYTFDDEGNQMWLIGTDSSTDRSVVRVRLFQPQGTHFGFQFNSQQVIKERWGLLTLRFESCNKAVASFKSTDEDRFGSGSIPIIKLSNHVDSVCDAQRPTAESPDYSQRSPQGIGVGLFTSGGSHDVDGVIIVSERLFLKNGQCHLKVELKNNTGRRKVSAELAYDFFADNDVYIGASGVFARFTKKGQNIVKENVVSVFHLDYQDDTSCDIFHRIGVGGSLIPVR